jgi:cytoskeletal protein CcmA (bactofilin family)
MFGKTKAPGEILAIDAFKTFIDASTVMEGRIVFAESIRIDGKVLGNVEVEPGATGSVAVGPGAIVRGDIVAHRVLIAGTVQGNIRALETVQLMDGARVTGDISYQSISIVQGASINGALTESSGSEEPSSEKRRKLLRLAVDSNGSGSASPDPAVKAGGS